MNQVEFRHAVKEGTILAIESTLLKKGSTSVCYQILVRRGRAQEGEPIFSTEITFVNVDETGEKQPLAE